MIIIETCPECGHDLVNSVICTNPPIPKKECLNCGWSWEDNRKEVIRMPFVETYKSIQQHGDVYEINSDGTLGNKIGSCSILSCF